MRSLKYKSKISVTNNSQSPKKNKNAQDDDEQEEEEEYEEREEHIDMQTWKRRNGVGYNQKVFIIKGGYHDLRKALISRGWY